MRVTLGTMQMGEEVSEEISFKILNYYIKQGLYKIDTAQMYPIPSSKNNFKLTEKILGKWINSLGLYERNLIKISTKFPNYSKKLGYLRRNNSEIISYKELKDSLIGSLKRLNLENVETFFIHWPSRNINNFGKSFYKSTGRENFLYENLMETFSNFSRLINDGLCKSIGISNESAIALHSA